MRLRLPKRVGDHQDWAKQFSIGDAIRIVDALILFATGRKWNRADRRHFVLSVLRSKRKPLILHNGRITVAVR